MTTFEKIVFGLLLILLATEEMMAKNLTINVDSIVTVNDGKPEISCIIVNWNNISMDGNYKIDYCDRTLVGLYEVLRTYETPNLMVHKMCDKKIIKSSALVKVQVTNEKETNNTKIVSATFDLKTFKEIIIRSSTQSNENEPLSIHFWTSTVVAAMLLLVVFVLICKVTNVCCFSSGSCCCRNQGEQDTTPEDIIELHSSYKVNNNELNRSQNIYEPIPGENQNQQNKTNDGDFVVDVDKLHENYMSRKTDQVENTGTDDYQSQDPYDDVMVESEYDDVALLSKDNRDSSQVQKDESDNGRKQYTPLTAVVEPEMYETMEAENDCEAEENEALLKSSEVSVLPQYKKDGSEKIPVYNPEAWKKDENNLKLKEAKYYEEFKAMNDGDSKFIYTEPNYKNDETTAKAEEFNYSNNSPLPKGGNVRNTIYEINEDGSRNQAKKSEKPQQSEYELKDVELHNSQKLRPGTKPDSGKHETKSGNKPSSLVETRRKNFEKKELKSSPEPRRRGKNNPSGSKQRNSAGI